MTSSHSEKLLFSFILVKYKQNKFKSYLRQYENENSSGILKPELPEIERIRANNPK